MRALRELKFLCSDLSRWDVKGWKGVFYLFFEAGMWGAVLYRLSRCLYLVDLWGVRILFRFLAFLLFKVNEFIGCSIPPECEIGPGLYIGHTGCIFFFHTVKAGKNLSLGHGVTVGTRGLGREGAPVLGDDVYIGVGAKVLGPIRVGDRVRIGANAVVIHDVDSDSTVVGVPARVVRVRKDVERGE